MSDLENSVHEWWIVFTLSREGKQITHWNGLRESKISRFDTFNKEKVPRDKFAKWRQVENVVTFNQDFQKISYLLKILVERDNIFAP